MISGSCALSHVQVHCVLFRAVSQLFAFKHGLTQRRLGEFIQWVDVVWNGARMCKIRTNEHVRRIAERVKTETRAKTRTKRSRSAPPSPNSQQQRKLRSCTADARRKYASVNTINALEKKVAEQAVTLAEQKDALAASEVMLKQLNEQIHSGRENEARISAQLNFLQQEYDAIPMTDRDIRADARESQRTQAQREQKEDQDRALLAEQIRKLAGKNALVRRAVVAERKAARFIAEAITCPEKLDF